MKTEILTHRYEFAHGKAPRGRGSWAFHPNFNVDASDRSIFWTPSVTWQEAKKLAVAHFSALGVPAVHALS